MAETGIAIRFIREWNMDVDSQPRAVVTLTIFDKVYMLISADVRDIPVAQKVREALAYLNGEDRPS